ncbi:MAG: hypothetical protein JXA10_06230 [Anaerolineae bacterium]|nr:hypothetical protein [Anaerolineae bacterium]
MIKRLVGQFNIIGKAALSSLAPSLTRLLLILLGLILGLVWAYQFAPVTFQDTAEPVHLNSGYKDQWIKMTAQMYAASGNTAEAKAEAERQIVDGGVKAKMIEDLIADNQGVEPLASQLQALLPVAQGVESQAKSKADDLNAGFVNNVVMGPIGCIIGYLLVGIILALVLTFYITIPIGPWRKKKPISTVSVASGGASGAEILAATMAEKKRVAEQKTDFAAEGERPPVTQHMSTYILGDDLYDDSFSIETARREDSGEFLGEYGSGISETIGVGDPKKVTAIEAWLFDKNDIRTVTKVLMSEHAFNDQALRTKLAPKGEAVMVTPNGTTWLETQTLRVRVRVVDLQYGEGALPPNSFFERLTIELAAWQKEAEADGGSDAPLQPPDASAAFGDTAELLNY